MEHFLSFPLQTAGPGNTKIRFEGGPACVLSLSILVVSPFVSLLPVSSSSFGLF